MSKFKFILFLIWFLNKVLKSLIFVKIIFFLVFKLMQLNAILLSKFNSAIFIFDNKLIISLLLLLFSGISIAILNSSFFAQFASPFV